MLETESIGPNQGSTGVLGVRLRVERHAGGDNTFRPGFLITDWPPHAAVTVRTGRGGSRGSNMGGSHLGSHGSSVVKGIFLVPGSECPSIPNVHSPVVQATGHHQEQGRPWH